MSLADTRCRAEIHPKPPTTHPHILVGPQVLRRYERRVGRVTVGYRLWRLLDSPFEGTAGDPEHLDVTDPAAIRDVVDRSFAALGRIDVIVSNAGYGLFGAAEELTDRPRSPPPPTPHRTRKDQD